MDRKVTREARNERRIAGLAERVGDEDAELVPAADVDPAVGTGGDGEGGGVVRQGDGAPAGAVELEQPLQVSDVEETPTVLRHREALGPAAVLGRGDVPDEREAALGGRGRGQSPGCRAEGRQRRKDRPRDRPPHGCAILE